MSDKTINEKDKFCAICGKSEAEAGKLLPMPGSAGICEGCIQKTMKDWSNSFAALFTGGNDFREVKEEEPSGAAEEVPAEDRAMTELPEAEENAPFGASEEPAENTDSDDEEEEQNKGNIFGFDLSKMGGIPIFNLGDLGFGEMPGRAKVKKKKNKEKVPFDRKAVPAPHQIKAMLDEHVVGQEKAKKAMSVAVYNHYKRIGSDNSDGVEIEKSNMLLLGPTGSGKTYLVKTLAKLLDVPLAIADATSLTEAGYIGDDIESVVSKLLAAADNDVDKAEHGIIYIDEIDKIAKKKNTMSRDVSGESVQQELLKMLEGSVVEVPVGSNSKNAMVPMTQVNTENILFICGGAFPDLEDIVKERLTKEAAIGFRAQLKDSCDNDHDLLCKAEIADLRKFGMIPEFLGRLPVLVTLEALSKEFMVRILKEPKNAILKQYQKLMAMDEVQLEFDDDALEAIAEKAMKKDTGARALRAVIEEYMQDIMYEIPKDENIGTVTITRAYIEHTGGPGIEMRGVKALPAPKN